MMPVTLKLQGGKVQFFLTPRICRWSWKKAQRMFCEGVGRPWTPYAGRGEHSLSPAHLPALGATRQQSAAIRSAGNDEHLCVTWGNYFLPQRMTRCSQGVTPWILPAFCRVPLVTYCVQQVLNKCSVGLSASMWGLLQKLEKSVQKSIP